MRALEYHQIDAILRKFDVSLPRDVVAALADAARDVAVSQTGEPSIEDAVRPGGADKPEPHSWFVEVGGGELRYAREPHVIDEVGLIITDMDLWQPLYAHPVEGTAPHVEEGAEGVAKGLVCAKDLCEDYGKTADNYQKRLAAFQCVKLIREALAGFDAIPGSDESAPAGKSATIGEPAASRGHQSEAAPHLSSQKAVKWQRRCMVNGNAISDWLDMPETCIDVELQLGNEVRELFPGPVIRSAVKTTSGTRSPEGLSTAELLGAQHRLLSWNRRQAKPPIAIGMEYSVAAAAVEALSGAQ